MCLLLVSLLADFIGDVGAGDKVRRKGLLDCKLMLSPGEVPLSALMIDMVSPCIRFCY